MKLTPINIKIEEYPAEFVEFLKNAKVFDSSCSKQAKVIFIEKEDGYFLKKSAKGSLKREAALTKYFNSLGLSTEVLEYISCCDFDWLLTKKIAGDDCIAPKYLENPTKLCDTIAELLAKLHSIAPIGCPVPNHTQLYLEKAEKNFLSGDYDISELDSWGYKNAKEAWYVVKNYGHLLKTDTLLHGDYCLPNIILNNWKFSGFIDIDCGGVGDRHVDLFWGAWTLFYNLKTDKYRERFFDVYGRDKIDRDILKIVAAVEVFG